jgi:hypothetical protein
MSNFYLSLIAFILGVFFIIFLFLLMRLLIYLKLSFEKIFNSIEQTIQRFNNILDSTNKYK